jgi:hypothetical protein
VTEATLRVEPAAPFNDNLAGATEVRSLPFSARIDSSRAGAEPGERAAPCAAGAAHGIWYRLVPQQTAVYELDTAGSSFPTVLSIWRGERHPLAPTACGPVDPADGKPTLRARLTAGEAYHLKVESRGEVTGPAVLNIRRSERGLGTVTHLPWVGR